MTLTSQNFREKYLFKKVLLKLIILRVVNSDNTVVSKIMELLMTLLYNRRKANCSFSSNSANTIAFYRKVAVELNIL